ncbi:MAG: rhombosortase [Burkholderiaceae bacterium]
MTRRPAQADGAAWLAVTGLLVAGAVLVAALSAAGPSWPAALDWQPGFESRQPWRVWTSAWVHWSAAHLAVNLAGAAVVGAVGWRARAPFEAAAAWFIAWPLTQALMTLADTAAPPQALQHYGGLSGVLHAGVIVLGLTLAWPRAVPASAGLPQAPRDRWIGAAITIGTIAKVLMETPWDPTLRPNALLGISVAPLAHACGILAGAVAWAVARAVAANAAAGAGAGD